MLDPGSGKIIGRVDGLRPEGCDAEFAADGHTLYVSIIGGQGGVAVIDVRPRPARGGIVFASDRGGEGYQLFRMDADGQNLGRLTENHAVDCHPRWSPDGRTIAFLSNRDGPARIFLMHGDDFPALPLQNTDPVLGDNGPYYFSAPLDWSPDGNRIAFVADECRAVRIVDVIGGKVRTVVQGTIEGRYGHHCGVAWRKSGRALFVSSTLPGMVYDHRIFQIDLETNAVSTVCNDEQGTRIHTSPAVSPDDAWIAVTPVDKRKKEPHGIRLLGIGGTAAKELPGIAEMHLASPRWSSDGRHLVFSAGPIDGRESFAVSHIVLIDESSGQPTQLTTGDWKDVHPDIFGSVRPPTAPPSPTATLSRVPYHVRGRLKYVPVEANDKKTVEMAIDTGAEVVSLPWQVAEAAGINPGLGKPVAMKGANARAVTAYMVTIAKVRIGMFIANHVECIVSLPEKGDVPLLLGQSFLNRFNCQLDTAEQTLILSGLKDSGR